MKMIEKMAEEWAQDWYDDTPESLSEASALNLAKVSGSTGFLAGWRACREAAINRLNNFSGVVESLGDVLESFGEEEIVPETAESETQKD